MKREREQTTPVPELPAEVWALVAQQAEPRDAVRLMQCTRHLAAAFKSTRKALRRAMAPKLWHVERHDKGDWDTYSDFVCCCATEHEARAWHPSEHPPQRCAEQTVAHWLRGDPPQLSGDWLDDARPDYRREDWIHPEERHLLKVWRLGVADAGVARDLVCASYHAG